jgi:hypothetical protein
MLNTEHSSVNTVSRSQDGGNEITVQFQANFLFLTCTLAVDP